MAGRAVDLVDQPAGDGIDVRAHRPWEVRLLHGRAQIVGGVRRVAGVARVEVGGDTVAELGEVAGGGGRDRRGLGDRRPSSARAARREAKGHQGERSRQPHGSQFPIDIAQITWSLSHYPSLAAGNRCSWSPAAGGSGGSQGRSWSARRARRPNPLVLRIRRWCRQRSQRPAGGRLTAPLLRPRRPRRLPLPARLPSPPPRRLPRRGPQPAPLRRSRASDPPPRTRHPAGRARAARSA